MMKQLEDILRARGIDPDSIPGEKSDFQVNQEMAAMLLTLAMTEVDFLRMRIEKLETEIEALKGGAGV